jgi:hypothetical protein
MNRRIWLTLFALLSLSYAARADPPGACGAITYNLGNSGTGALVSPGDSSAGCEQANSVFSNFNYNQGLGSPTAGSNINATFAGTDEIAGISMTFASSDWTQAASGEQVGLIPFSASPDPAVTPPGGGTWAITGLSLSVTGASAVGNSPSDFVEIVEQFCTGVSAFSCNNLDGNFGKIEILVRGTGTVVVSCYNNGATGVGDPCNTSVSGSTSITFPATTSIAIEEIVELGSDGNQTESLDSLTGTMFQTAIPEPSTFVLLGSALSGWGLLSLMRRRRIPARER